MSINNTAFIGIGSNKGNRKENCETAVKIIAADKDTAIIRILLEILSEIPFERQWVGESKLREQMQVASTPFEGWFIYRIGETDFCILGRAYYQHNVRDKLISELEILSKKMLRLIE